MDTRDIVELVTVLSGAAVSIAGAVQQIRARKAGDADLVATAGAEAVARSKAAQGVALYSRTESDERNERLG